MEQERICRAVGVAVHEGCVLLAKAAADDFWHLPGGGCWKFETTKEALVREFREETGEDISVGRLIWVLENMYECGGPQHELEFYYQVSLPKGSPFLKKESTHCGYEVELDMAMEFSWFPLEELDSVTLYPELVKVKLKNIPLHIEHLVRKEL